MSLFAKNEPKLPPAPTIPNVTQLRRAPEVQMSEFYARAMQEFQDVQTELKTLQSERDALKVDLEVERRENERLRHEVEAVTESKNLYMRRVNEIETRFDDVSALILRVMDSRLTEPRTQPTQTPAQLDQLEQHLTLGPHEDANGR